MRNGSQRLGVLVILCGGAAIAAAQVPVSTAFTYQGQLKENGNAANADYDLRFRLYDALTGGNQIGAVITVDDWPVADGQFMLQLDFGAGVFGGDARWLEVEVRPGASAGSYNTLTPRQALTATPYALYALSGPGSGGFWEANGDHIFNNNSGSVGIGTTTPESHLEVVGAILSTGPDGGSISTRNPNNQTASFSLGWLNDVARLRIGGNGPGAGGGLDIQRTGDASLMRILHNGSIGIGTTVPAARLHITGSAGVDGIMFPDGTLQTTAAGAGGGLWSANGNDIYYRNGDVAVGTTSPDFTFHVRKQVAIGSGQPAATMGLQWTQNGVPFIHDWLTFRVGGTFLRPVGQEGTHIIRKSGEKLHFSVEQTMNSGSLTPQLTLTASGRLGLGTTNPERVLHTVGNAVLIERDRNDAAVILRNTLNGEINAHFGLSSTALNEGFAYLTDQTQTQTLVLRNHNVGINRENPTARLHIDSADEQLAQFTQLGTDPGMVVTSINGSTIYPALQVNGFSSNAPAMRVVGTASVDVLEITGADLAERFPVSEEVKAGMVMEIDPDHAGKLRLSRGVYNRRVAGVASGAGDIPTGAILGNLPGHEAAPPVALSGRVWVFCDASETAVELGDLLTTSATPGHAMAVRDFTRSPGATLGKAMTSLAKGEKGLVLVLVNLQ